MGWYNTTGYQPDHNLTKLMAGGGLGGFLSNLGGVMNKSYTDMKKNEDDLEAQRVASFNADTQRQNSNNIGNYYNQQVEAQKQRMAQEQMDRDTAFNASASQFLDKNPNAGVPMAGDIATMPMDTQTAVKGWMANEAQKIAEQKALDQKAIDMARSLSDYEAKKRIDQKYSTSNTTDIFGAGMKDINVGGKDVKAVHIGNGNFFDGTRMYKAGEYTLGTVPKVEAPKEPTVADRRAVHEYDRDASAYVDDALKTVDTKWQSFANIWSDKAEKEPQARMELHRMYKNNEVSGLTKEEAIKEAYRRVGAPFSMFGPKITEEQQAKSFTGSVLNGDDPSKITPEVIKQSLNLSGVKYSDEIVDILTKDFQAKAKSKADYKNTISKFATDNKLNVGDMDRFSNKAKDTVLTVAHNTFGKGGLDVLPNEWSKHIEEQKDAPKYNTNWSVANEQIDVAPILVEIAKYAPTVGMSPVAFGGRFANILGNAAMFGSADAMMAELYGDDWRTAAAYGAIPMGAYGAFMKVKKATPKP